VNEIQGKRRKPIGGKTIIGCPIHVCTLRRKRSLIKGEWVFPHYLDVLIRGLMMVCDPI